MRAEAGAPGLVRETADLDAGVALGGRVEEGPVAEGEADVGDDGWAVGEEEEVAGKQMCARDGDEAAPVALGLRVARDHDAALPMKRLHEAGAVEAEGRDAAPGVGKAEEAMAESEHLFGCKSVLAGGDVASQDEGGLAIEEPDLQPAIACLFGVGKGFEACLPGQVKERSVLLNIWLAVDVCAEGTNAHSGCGHRCV